MSKFKTFKDLHYAKTLFVLPNAWNVVSASLLEQSGFPALATSSSAVAESIGYGDGEKMPFSDYLFVIRRIASSITIPFTVDLEMGYGKDARQIYENISRLVDEGVVGINLEDSQILESKRGLQNADTFARKLETVKGLLENNGKQVFVNVRSDTYLLNIDNKLEETKRRAKLYQSSGADGLFLPCIVSNADISVASESTRLPLNVMCYKGLDDFDALSSLGVKRLSLGGSLFDYVYGKIKNVSKSVLQGKTLELLLKGDAD